MPQSPHTTTWDASSSKWARNMGAFWLPLCPTNPAWITAALSDLDAVLSDHLHCERKAAQSALSLVRAYPDKIEVLAAVTRLAHEETSHVVQVSLALAKRKQSPTYDAGDDLATGLRKEVRKHEPERLLDSLLVFALIEARSAERLGLLAEALPNVDPELADMYRVLATAELRHRDTFLELAAGVAPKEWLTRLAQLTACEAAIIQTLPCAARIH